MKVERCMLVIEMNFAKLFVFWLTISFILYTSLGEVTEMTPVETENPMGGYGKTVAHVIIGLKTAKGIHEIKDVVVWLGQKED